MHKISESYFEQTHQRFSYVYALKFIPNFQTHNLASVFFITVGRLGVSYFTDMECSLKSGVNLGSKESNFWLYHL